MYLGKVVKYPSLDKSIGVFQGVPDIFVVLVSHNKISNESFLFNSDVSISIPWGCWYFSIPVGSFCDAKRNLSSQLVSHGESLVKFSKFEFKRIASPNEPIAYRTSLMDFDASQQYFLWVDRHDRMFIEVFDKEDFPPKGSKVEEVSEE